MQFYSASALRTILQNCLKNLERSTDPDEPAVKELKRALLLHLAELGTSVDKGSVKSIIAVRVNHV